jgi:hypothetical protein
MSEHLPGETERTTKNLSHESRSEYHSAVTLVLMFNRGIMKCINCSIDLLLYILALEGHFEITMS